MHYAGSKTRWNKITVGEGNEDTLLNAKLVCAVDGTTYYYRVRAVIEGVNGKFSNLVSVIAE